MYLRLCRSNKDWAHRTETCGFWDTLLGNQDGIYDPNDINDRMLLGLKGTMSELELGLMRNRLYDHVYVYVVVRAPPRSMLAYVVSSARG